MNLAHRLWHRLGLGAHQPADDGSRWVVLDTETTGLDVRRDRLLSIGAVAVEGDSIRIGDSFEVLLRTEGAGSAQNIVVHGIGHEAQRQGVPAEEALKAFTAFVAEAPCVAYNVDFDRAVLDGAYAAAGLRPLSGPWLDVAPLAGVLATGPGPTTAMGLDDWLVRFEIAVDARHHAAADALATAELLLRLRAIAAAQGSRGFAALARVSRQRRWLQ
jgi:DNA polymerase III subunit epsilon